MRYCLRNKMYLLAKEEKYMASKYDKTIKQRVVFDYESGMLIKEIVDKYKIPRGTINEWVYSNKRRIDNHNKNYKKSEVVIFKNIINRQDTTLKIYKRLRAAVPIPEDVLLKIAFELYKDGYSPTHVCNVIGLEKTKFYRYLKNKDKLTWFEKDTLKITPLIIEIFEKSKGRFGPQK